MALTYVHIMRFTTVVLLQLHLVQSWLGLMELRQVDGMQAPSIGEVPSGQDPCLDAEI